MTKLARHSATLALFLAVSLSPATSGPQGADPDSTVAPGRSVTLLPEGRWLLLGGETPAGPRATVGLWDIPTQTLVRLPATMRRARAWHSATLLPDGSVLIVGGVGRDGRVLEAVEVFDPLSQSFRELPAPGLRPRAHHTATLLTEGRVLIAGGVDESGAALDTAELWDPGATASSPLSATLTAPRQRHAATLLPDGRVWLHGGVDATGAALRGDEIFDPTLGSFSAVATSPAFPDPSIPPAVEASLPTSGAIGVPVDAMPTVRFSRPLRVETLNATTVTLVGPRGAETVRVTPAESGMLLFVVPEAFLAPGASYTLSLNGPVDSSGFLLPATGIAFTTEGDSRNDVDHGREEATAVVTPRHAPLPDVAAAQADDTEPWIPDARHRRGRWRIDHPDSPSRARPPLQAAPGVTALAGQVLTLTGNPLAEVTLQVEAGEGVSPITTRTDRTGRFLLEGIPPGHQELVIDGRTASRPGRTYGVFEVGVKVTAGQTNVLSSTIWMPRIDTAHAVRIPSPTTAEMVITTPHIPGLELRLPKGTVVYDHEGHVVREVSITPIPVDRPPFPLPERIQVPVYFTVQPGGAYVYTPNHRGARLVYPNYLNERRGTRANFWHYDPGEKGWHIYGLGSVTEDTRQVVPDPGVSVYELTGAMINVPDYGPPPKGPAPGSKAEDGEPVDLTTGLFILRKPDLVLADVLPLALTRTYRQGDTASRAFGIGATHNYDLFLWSAQQYQQADLILPDGGQVHYVRISGGSGFTDAEFEHTGTPTRYHRSRIKWNGLGWDLTLKDGTVYVFGDEAPLSAIRDRHGNTITISRAGVNGFGSPTGNITRLTSPSGRWIELTYDTAVPTRIVQARDNAGRTVTYQYDATGRLTAVIDPRQGPTEYTYDVAHRLLTIKDARLITFLTNVYDGNGRVQMQTQADQSTFHFAYGLDATGLRVTQTDVTDPRGTLRRVTFNADGYKLTDTRATGTPSAQTTAFELQPSTNLVLSVTDALGRKTSFTYDAMGNVTRVTRLAGAPDAVATTYTYEPAFHQVATATDPLQHTARFDYDAQGNLSAVTNPLNDPPITLTYDDAGQPVTITDPLGHPSAFSYAFGDLTTVTDPLTGTTRRYTDAAGRLVALTSPLGRTTSYDYDPLNALTRLTDPLRGETTFTYDPNGNLLQVRDARQQPAGPATQYTYNSMDRLATRTDPTGKVESYQYDAAGNLVTVTDRRGNVTTYTYDALNRRTFAGFGTTGTGPTATYKRSFTYTWDAGNRLTTVVDSLGPKTTTFTRDGLDRLTREVVTQGATPVSTVDYAYDTAGRRTSMTLAGQPPVIYTYDAANRLTQLTQGTAVVTIEYDAAGRRFRLTLPTGVSVDYAYDVAARLIGLSFARGATPLGTLTYTYDADGNRTRAGGSWARTALPPALTAAATTYNTANRQTKFAGVTFTYVADGSLKSDGVNTYTWDTRGHLTGISGPGLTASFRYDAFGRRTKKTINGVTTEFRYDGFNPIQEIVSTSGVPGTVVTNFLTSLELDELLTRTDASGTQGFVTDALGSTQALVDAAGNLHAEYTYEPFGVTAVSGAGGSAFQFTGRENDGIGLYYYRARYYSPRFQRFISEDPIGFRGGVNLYAYALNSPLNWTDPLGLDVTISMYPCCYGANHLGIGVNTTDTVGYRPVTPNMPLDDGHVSRDILHYPSGPTDSFTLKTSARQDRAIQDFIDQRKKKPDNYNLFGRHCGTFVSEALREAGIDAPDVLFPRSLFDYLKQRWLSGEDFVR